MMGWAGFAQAGMPQPMVGSSVIINPSITGQLNERGPAFVGNGPATFGTISTSGRNLTLPAAQFLFTGVQTRFFPGVPQVAQVTAIYTTTQRAAVFRSGSGAAAAGDISFCPAIGMPTGTPPFATGNTACTDFAAAGSGNFAIRLGVNNVNNGPFFGGTLELLKNRFGLAWLVVQQPPTPLATAIVLKASNLTSAGRCPSTNPDCNLWTPGITNYRFMTNFAAATQLYGATLTASGRIGGIVSTLPPGTGSPPDSSAWGFKLTTGTVSGSNSVFTSFSFFTRQGYDNRVTTSGGAVTGNIQMVAGAIATSPSTGSLFNRVQILKMRVPEPGIGLSIVAGVLGLAGLMRRRSRP